MLTGDGVRGGVTQAHIIHSTFPRLSLWTYSEPRTLLGTLDPEKRLTFSLPLKDIPPSREGSHEVSPLRAEGIAPGLRGGTEEGHLTQPIWGKRTGSS